MERPARTRGESVRRAAVFALVLGLALAARADHPLPEDVRALSAAAQATIPFPSDPPFSAQGAKEAGLQAAVTFSDVDAEPTGAESLGVAPSPTPAALPAEESDAWAYADERIQVAIERHTQDDFVYFTVDIRLTDPSQFSYAFSHEKYGAGTEALSDIAERHDPLVAVNGDYYSFHNNGIIIRGGELFRKQKSSRHLLIVDKNGDLSVLTDRRERQADVARRLMDEGVLHTFEFGPVLIENGEAVELSSAIVRVGKGYQEPRTAIGQFGPLHYLLIVVDGRSPGYSEGCDLPTLQELFLSSGVSTAFNLDGGGSTTLWFDKQVVNRPSSGDERKVSDIVMFLR